MVGVGGRTVREKALASIEKTTVFYSDIPRLGRSQNLSSFEGGVPEGGVKNCPVVSVEEFSLFSATVVGSHSGSWGSRGKRQALCYLLCYVLRLRKALVRQSPAPSHLGSHGP